MNLKRFSAGEAVATVREIWLFVDHAQKCFGIPAQLENTAMSNQIQVIAPYWHLGTWVFDDPTTDLVKEPFVSGVPEMINDLVADISNARQGFRLLFSADPFPGFQRKLEWVRTEFDGNWYRMDEPPMEGWLCPAMFHYFEEAPAELYVKADEIR
jgi:hypothetical protein